MRVLPVCKKAGKMKEKAILDTGLIPNTKGSRVYAALKGISDSGINISFNDKVLPSNERIAGKNIKLEEDVFNKIRDKIQK